MTAIVCVLSAVAFLITFALYLSQYNQIDHTNCRSGTSAFESVTSTGVYSLVVNVTDPPTCTKPLLQLSLTSIDSAVEVREDYCRNIQTELLNVTSDSFNLSLADYPLPVFDENYPQSELPQNYFINGSINVTISTDGLVNMVDKKSASVKVCLFTNNFEYHKFLKAGPDWKNYTQNADCRTVSVDGGSANVSLFQISKPSFVFVGIAALTQFTNTIYLNLNFNAQGYRIFGFGKSSRKVCQLIGDDNELKNCNFYLLNSTAETNESICIIAFEEAHSDGSFHYSNITGTLPTSAETSGKGQISVFISLFVLSALSFISVFAVLAVLWKCCRRQIGNGDQNPDTGHIQADPMPHLASASSDNTSNSALVVTQRRPTRGVIQDSNGQTREQSPAVGEAAQERTPFPVQETSENDSKQTEEKSSHRFGYGISETAEES